MTCTSQLEDVPELIHRIQWFLPEKEAVRTCILSKSWLQAQSTIPTLMFTKYELNLTEEKEAKYIDWIDRTLQRYHRDNIPLEIFLLFFSIRNEKLASVIEKWISLVTSKSFLKELSLFFKLENGSSFKNPILTVTTDVKIKCVFLRVLALTYVNISDEVLHNFLSTCKLLEKIKLVICNGLKTIKVKNLPCLHKLQIRSLEKHDILEIDDVPSLRLFQYSPPYQRICKPLPFNTDSLGSVTRLDIHWVMIDNAFLDIIRTKLPFLESLTLEDGFDGLEIVVIKSVSLKRLTILPGFRKSIDIQVYAPKLVFFCYNGHTVPRLSFSTKDPERIKLTVKLMDPIDHSFVLTMREALYFSSKIDIEILHYSHHPLSLNTNVDDLRGLVSCPATNVEQLSLETFSDEKVWEDTRFFDALFIICQPKYVKAKRQYLKEKRLLVDNKYFFKLLVTGIMERKTSDLADVELKTHVNGKWEAITSSWRSVLDRLPNQLSVEFKLNWFSP